MNTSHLRECLQQPASSSRPLVPIWSLVRSLSSRSQEVKSTWCSTPPRRRQGRRELCWHIQRHFHSLLVSHNYVDWSAVLILRGIETDSAAILFKGFHWIRCAEDLMSHFDARMLPLKQGQSWISPKLRGRYLPSSNSLDAWRRIFGLSHMLLLDLQN